MDPKIIIERSFAQRTDKWAQIKVGKTSGSLIKPILTARSKKPWETYAYTLIAQQENTELATYEDGYLSKAAQWGQDTEPFAQKAFEEKTGKFIEEVAWVESLDPKLKGKSGCSPDGIIDIIEWVEIKSLNSSNHIKYVTENVLPKEYEPQIMNYFVINPDLEVVHFILYDPRIKSKQLHIIPVLREDYKAQIQKLYDNLVEFHVLKEELHKKFLKK